MTAPRKAEFIYRNGSFRYPAAQHGKDSVDNPIRHMMSKPPNQLFSREDNSTHHTSPNCRNTLYFHENAKHAPQTKQPRPFLIHKYSRKKRNYTIRCIVLQTINTNSVALTPQHRRSQRVTYVFLSDCPNLSTRCSSASFCFLYTENLCVPLGHDR